MVVERESRMKRMLVVLSIVAAAALVGVAAGGASVAPSSVFCIAGNTVTLNLSDEGEFSAAVFYQAAANEGGFWYFTDEGTEETDEIPIGNDGDEFLPSDPEGPFSAPDFTFISVGAGPCIRPAAPQVDNVFLCYSTFSNVPAVFPAPVAAALLKGGGYWTPYAVPGTADGGTNIGAYHLVCNLASGQAAGSNTLGGAGEVDGANTKPNTTNVPGYYPIIGG
jgi:hypothetical protein